MKKRLRIWFREYFSFSRTERNGILVLAGILFCLIALRMYMGNRPAEPVQVDQAWLDSMDALFAADSQEQNAAFDTPDEQESPSEALRSFDPNRESYDALISLGFFPRVAKNIISYRAAGGEFRKPEDLLKIHGMSEKFYRRIEVYIVIPGGTQPAKEAEVEGKFTRKPMIVEINAADTNELKKLPGIGSYFARKIVSYRESLGGYYSFDQLTEVYNLRAGLLDTLRPFLKLDTAGIRPIMINMASEMELYAHPYIRKKAAALLAYRNNRNGLKGPDDLSGFKAFTPEELKRLLPYLMF